MKLSLCARLGVAALSVAALGSCAATSLTSSWADPAAANRSFQKVVVVGVTPKSAVRRLYEDEFAAQLHDRGVNAVPSYQLVGEGQLDKDQAAAKLREA